MGGMMDLANTSAGAYIFTSSWVIWLPQLDAGQVMNSHVVLSSCMLSHCRKHVWQTSGSWAHAERLGKSWTGNESAQTMHSRSLGGGVGEGSFRG